MLFDLPDAKVGQQERHRAAGDREPEETEPGAARQSSDDASFIQAANYEEHLELLRGCDVVIEAIAERMDWKHDLYRKVAPFVATTRSSRRTPRGFRSQGLSEALDDAPGKRFCGVHFFNPPRYMHLVELIPTPATRRRDSR